MTKTNDNTHCAPELHDFEASLVEAGTEKCRWCPVTREAAPAPVVGVDLPGAAVRAVVEARRAA